MACAACSSQWLAASTAAQAHSSSSSHEPHFVVPHTSGRASFASASVRPTSRVTSSAMSSTSGFFFSSNRVTGYGHSSGTNGSNGSSSSNSRSSRHGSKHASRRCAPLTRAYMDKLPSSAIVEFVSDTQAKLPILGLMTRLFGAEGAVGSERLRFSEFCRIVEKNISIDTITAMEELEERFGKMARPQVLLLWCWVAAVGAGLIPSDFVLLSARRLRASMDLDYELDQIDVLLEEAIKKRPKTWRTTPLSVPIVARAEKALEAILLCSVGRQVMEDGDRALFVSILEGIFKDLKEGEAEEIVDRVLLKTG